MHVLIDLTQDCARPWGILQIKLLPIYKLNGINVTNLNSAAVMLGEVSNSLLDD